MTTTNPQEHWYWRRESVPAGAAVVVDIDGVLADASGRQLLRGSGDWRSFFDACDQDPLIDETSTLLNLLDPSLRVLLVTGRPRRVQTKTVEWLERFHVRWDLLVTRDFGDYSDGRWAWLLLDPVVTEAYSAKGHLGLWEWD